MLTLFLLKEDLRKFESTTRSVIYDLNGVDVLPPTVNLILMTYSTNQEIHRAVEDLRKINQREEVPNIDYFNRF